MTITNYIKERIKELKQFIKRNPSLWSPALFAIEELQAVLSKIEELEKGKHKSFFELDISIENPKIPEEQMEAFNIAMNMRTVFDQYNIDHSKLALFPDGVNDWEIVTGKIAGINVAYPKKLWK